MNNSSIIGNNYQDTLAAVVEDRLGDSRNDAAVVEQNLATVPVAATLEASLSAKLPTWDEAVADLDVGGLKVNGAAEILQADRDAEKASTNVIPPIDLAVQVRLQKIRGGWSVTEVERWVKDEFLEPLAEQSLTTEQLSRNLECLILTLKFAGYQAKTVKQYQKIWKQLAQAKQAKKTQEKQAEVGEQKAAGQVPARFSVRTSTLPEAYDPVYLDPQTKQRLAGSPPLSNFQTEGLYDNQKSEFLTNFSLLLTHETEVRDEFQPRKVFEGTLKLFGKQVPFRIDAEDYADSKKLTAAIIQTAGSRAVIYGTGGLLREAISTLSWQPGHHEAKQRVATTDFGWTPDNTAFLVPGGTITASGMLVAGNEAELKVDLQDEELARHLDLKPLSTQTDLRKLKQHVVQDLLKIHDRRVTYPLLGAVGAALLSRFAPDVPPFALWLVGLTGAGKSYAAKLFMNFFGDFPVASGKFGSWTSTSNFLQRQGYFFKDALYLVDDYKPEVSRQGEVLRVLQNYADRQGRGRLKADASSNTTRPIRGFLLSTGEDVPEHNASAVARSIVITVPQLAKDLSRSQRCLNQSKHYSSVTADFVRQVLSQQHGVHFAQRVANWQRYYYRNIAGEQNDSRIAGNFGLLAAGFYEMARYLGDVWPEWKAAVRQFLTQDLVRIRDDMVGATKEQQASEVFWSVLGGLLEFGAVVVDDDLHSTTGKSVIGKKVYGSSVAVGGPELFYISTDLALGAVNKSLRDQGKAELRISHKTLVEQLRRDGCLFGEDRQPLAPQGDQDAPTKQLRIDGKAKRCFITSRAWLMGGSAAPSRGRSNWSSQQMLPSRN